MNSPIEKLLTPELQVVTVRRPPYDTHYITAHPTTDSDPCTMFDAVAEFTRSRHAHIVSQFVFGGSDLVGSGVPDDERYDAYHDWPVTWIHGNGSSGARFSGTQATAITGPIETIWLDGEAVGSVMQDEYARYCVIGSVGPQDLTRSRPQQTDDTFERIDRTLREAGMSFENVVRTWIYLDDLLDWYDEFNAVRNTFFERRGIRQKFLPASTGIGAANSRGTALILDVLAIEPKTSEMEIQGIDSPLQCPAANYSSAFSRAVEVRLPDYRRLYVSGTASIDARGATAHTGDIQKQIDLTMEVADALLGLRHMSWSDITRAIAYFKDIEDAAMFHEYCKRHAMPPFPVALAHADICRDDLLFEIEMDAVQLSASDVPPHILDL